MLNYIETDLQRQQQNFYRCNNDNIYANNSLAIQVDNDQPYYGNSAAPDDGYSNYSMIINGNNNAEPSISTTASLPSYVPPYCSKFSITGQREQQRQPSPTYYCYYDNNNDRNDVFPAFNEYSSLLLTASTVDGFTSSATTMSTVSTRVDSQDEQEEQEQPESQFHDNAKCTTTPRKTPATLRKALQQTLPRSISDNNSMIINNSSTVKTMATTPTENKTEKKAKSPDRITSSKMIIDEKTLPPSTRLVHCYNCYVTRTPLWRRTADKEHPLCNACGLYYKQYKQHRPPSNQRKKRCQQQRSSSSLVSTAIPFSDNNNDIQQEQQNYNTSSALSLARSLSSTSTVMLYDDTFLQCANCKQTETPLWRKNRRGETICNACGLYARMYKRDRPVQMRKSTIQKRRRYDDTMVDENPATAAAVERASCGAYNDQNFIEFVKRMGSRKEIQEQLEQYKQKCSFLQAVLDNMPDEQQER